LAVEFLPLQAFEDGRGLEIEHTEFSLEYSFVRRSLNIHVWLGMAPMAEWNGTSSCKDACNGADMTRP
jgi:hypothetical protein